MYNPYSLTGKTILVTGASSGIGRATAIEASRMGGKIVLSGRNTERLEETLASLDGDGHLTIPADICDDESLKELVKELPHLDGIVVCSGITELAPTQFATRKKFDKIFNTNFFGNVELIRLIQKSKKINQGASIVVIASVGGTTITSYGNGMYGASKAALASWTKFLAFELAAKKVRVNSISPGMVLTPLTNVGTFTQEQLDADAELYPLKRYGKPEEIAYAAVYFLSDASSWVTGTNFVIDGGRSI